MNDTTPTALRWGIKASLRSYLEQSGGEVRASDGAKVHDGTIEFAAKDAGGLEFAGEVHLLAHGGLLDWVIKDPAISPSRTQLLVSDARGDRLAIANLSMDCLPTLTADGAAIFEGMYHVGTSLDPLELLE